MTSSSHLSADLAEHWPPSIRLLLGESASQLWSAVLAPLGGSLRGLRATNVSLQPDGASTVQFSAVVTWSDGRETRESLAATTGARIPDGAAVLEGGSGRRPSGSVSGGGRWTRRSPGWRGAPPRSRSATGWSSSGWHPARRGCGSARTAPAGGQSSRRSTPTDRGT
ncbi:hypothetical protein [Blastococcus brunescens]|uniref:Uncharacterized protein n=1 Tax=Blastococcus brunescens TaxID=1564165 RepID=A0ABZ1B309_9ACTN|nr:hypothetical protein [Blastococcus sp. BMG 8361]WRL65129.1 hypothetical protein U6N30_05445 [Blastococcus sp. BMG 8361]